MHSGNPANPLNRQRLTQFMHSESKELGCPARARSRNECRRGSSARQSPRHVLRRPCSLPERVRMGEQRESESPIQGIPINRTNIGQVPRPYAAFPSVSSGVRHCPGESIDPRRPDAHPRECRAAGGRGRGRVGSPRQR